MGLWMYVWRKGRIAEATVHRRHRPAARGGLRRAAQPSAVVVRAACSTCRARRSWSRSASTASPRRCCRCGCCCRRAATSARSPRSAPSFLLAVGVIIVNPELQMPAITEFAGGGGPIIPGPLFPFCFITIACGAISGFHALISSGTTPKMIDKESDIRPDRLRRDADRRPGRHHGAGRGGLDGARATTSRSTSTPAGLRAPVLPGRADGTGATSPASRRRSAKPSTGRTGGAVSLAVGMAQIFSAAARA